MFLLKKSTLLTTALLSIVGFSSACSLLLNPPKIENNSNTNSDLNPEVSISSTLSSNNGSVAVSIKLPSYAPTGTIVRYTTDGSDPTTSGTALIYTFPFIVTGNTQTITVKAVAVDSNSTSSEIITKAPWFGEWEIVGNNYIENLDGGNASEQASSLYVDDSGTYLVSEKVYKWNGSSWSIVATSCYADDANSIRNFFVKSGAIYCTSYDGNNEVILRTIGGVATQLGASLGDTVASIVPCYNSVCAGISDPYNNTFMVKKYDSATNSWLPLVGNGTLSNNNGGWGALFSYKDRIYAEFSDNGHPKIMRYYDGSWEDISDTEASGPMFVYDDGSDNGILYVVFGRVGCPQPVVKMYNNVGWSEVGGNGGDVNIGTTYHAAYYSISVISGVPYVTYQDYTPAGVLVNGGHARTRFFNGSSWEDLGSISYAGDSFYTKSATYNGMLYRYINGGSGWWIESFGPNGSGTVSGGVANPLGI